MAPQTPNSPTEIPSSLLDLCSAINEPRRLLEKLEMVAAAASELTGSDHADITLFDGTLRRFVPQRSTQVFIHQGEPGIAERVRETKRPVLIPDVHMASEDEDLALFNRDISSYLAVPVMDGTRVDAVLIIFNREARHYDRGEMDALRGLASLISITLRQQRLSLGLEETRRTLLKLQMIDPVTGLATRQQFEQMLVHEWRRATGEGLGISLMQIEIEGIEEYAAQSQERSRREELAKLTRTLRSALYREGDMIALLGGDRLAVILPDTDFAGAQSIARRLQRDATAAALADDGPNLTLFIGVSSFDTLQLQHGVFGTPQKLLRSSVAALERAKKNGGNGIFQLELTE